MKRRQSKLLAVGAATACLVLAAPATAKDGIAVDADGLSFEEGDVELTLGGRLHLDAVTYDAQTSDSDADWRRARLEFSAKFGDVFDVRVDREFAGTDGWRNVWARIRPADGVEIKGGNVIVPFSLEDMQSSNDMTFVERSLTSALTPKFGLGAVAKVSDDHWTISGGYFGDALDDEDGQAKERGRGFAGRASFAPIEGRRGFLHFALAYEHRSFHSDETVSFSSSPGSLLAPNLISTGTIGSPSKMDNFGGEFAYARKSFQVQGQYVKSKLKRDFDPDLDYDGWYLQGSWMVTGERYRYSSSMGSPSGPRIRKKGGAIELAARYSELNLDDATLDRGKAKTITLGANWYINRNVRLMANYVRSEHTDVLLSPDSAVDLGVARFQIAF
ncbi:OprO/OprP family phosphate-selective porin [Tsuneonella sp. YG55]|uniref:OprO/OprP family phosphate-selective porin n=1 Tax=Tsuneonella litorea TaxID=2976475 RepID=A0A9X2W3B2_9SPHN|nr:OprO/OprP family phosphate-selective porin [Tsuneonella litorea]MCT2560225.1 OprO/OprP family phosphate-selective porin [Tsuneonella litorea]